MTYPAFPVGGNFPAFLDPFDPSFHLQSMAVILGTVTTPVPGVAGGAVVVAGGWSAGVLLTSPSPRTALFAWQYLNIVPPGNSGTSASCNWPGIVGPRRVYWSTDPGGHPFQT